MEQKVYRITGESLAYGGDCVAKIDGKVVFVPECVPGDTADIAIVEDKGAFMRGRMELLVEPSPDRVEPACPHADRCGGCQWQMLSYDAQLRWKRTIVEETLRRIGSLGGIEVGEVVPAPSLTGYRTTVRMPAKPSRDGLVMGYYERRSHTIVDVESCPVAVERINEFLPVFRSIWKEVNVREVTFQAGANHPSMLVTVLTRNATSLDNETAALFDAAPDLAGIVHRDKRGRHLHTYGSPYRYETVCGHTFRIEERSFFQANTSQTPALVDTVASMLPGAGEGLFVDAYGGVGLFSLTLAKGGRPVLLYDTSFTGVRDAKHNAAEAGLTAFTGIKGDTVRALGEVGGADCVVVDPPRSGLNEPSREAIAALKAPDIVYVSCNPATLARDLDWFDDKGYRVERVTPVDMFPHTYHIETVAHCTLR